MSMTVAADDLQGVFRARGDEIAEACTRCGDCFRACPMTEPAGLAAADPEETAASIVDLITGGDGDEVSVQWAEACSGSGYCIRPASTASTRASWCSWRAASPAATLATNRYRRAGDRASRR